MKWSVAIMVQSTKHTNAGSTPLHATTVAGEHKYVIELVKNGAIVNTQNTQNGKHPYIKHVH